MALEVGRLGRALCRRLCGTYMVALPPVEKRLYASLWSVSPHVLVSSGSTGRTRDGALACFRSMWASCMSSPVANAIHARGIPRRETTIIREERGAEGAEGAGESRGEQGTRMAEQPR